ncbi:NACHT domain-containing protein [Limnohabitans sp.]
MIPEALIIEKAEKQLDKSIDNLIDLAKNELKERFQKWKAKNEIEKLKENIRQVGQISTIASRKASTIDDIYYPAKIKHGAGSKTILSTDELFSNKKRIALIQGTAGQGKSVFLRYLCLRDLDYSGKIPIFVELRKIDENIDLITLIKKQLSIIGLTDDLINPAIEVMLRSGSIRLYLDGLDEIKREFSLETKDKINQLINKHDKLHIALTSRPGALSQNLIDMPHMEQYEIAALSEKDHIGFLTKIGTSKEIQDRLIASIQKSNAQIKNLLSTPLMLTLLVITCGQKQDLPDTLPEFYDSLFNLLSSMHDANKPGFTRQKATNLSNSELENLFRAFSYASKELIGKVTLNSTQFEETLNAALKITDLKCTTEGFRTEITETVCLMVKDGIDTTFTHKSIQEYYAASFIHRIEDDNIATTVFKNIEGENINSWLNELRFLEDFQNLAYEKSIGIPHSEDLTNAITLPNRKKLSISRTKFNSLISSTGIKIAQTKITKMIHGVYWFSPNNQSINRYLPDLLSIIAKEVKAHSKTLNKPQALGDNLTFISLKSIMHEDKALAERIFNAAERFVDGLYLKGKKMKERQERRNKGLLEILKKQPLGTKLK